MPPSARILIFQFKEIKLNLSIPNILFFEYFLFENIGDKNM